jgi:anti-sigma factor RsiW
MSADPSLPARCKRLEPLLGPWMDGELSGTEALEVERHLSECDSCRRLLAEDRAVWALLDRSSFSAAEELAEGRKFLAAVESRLRAGRARRRSAILAAAALLLLALGFFWFLRSREDQAIIENLAVLQDLQAAPAAGVAEVADVGRELLALLGEEEGGPLGDEWIELLEPGEDGEKGG